MRVRAVLLIALSFTATAWVVPGAAFRHDDSQQTEERTELSVLLARATTYVARYQRSFSAVVAEERYVQTQGSTRTTLKSDLLLLWPANSDTCVSFRDVLQANGARVRDRDDRLRKLFLGRADARVAEQLDAIKKESSRYNMGSVGRNVNVPLFALRVLNPENRARFAFRIGKSGKSAGVAVVRLEFEETRRPTLVSDSAGRDQIPLRGWFGVNPLTGAIVQSTLEANSSTLLSRFVVRYRQDEKLQMWVPQDMVESYSAVTGKGMMSATATYRNLRRFQVTTEENVSLPK